MTTEVAILNSNGVVLAADSMVTSGRKQGDMTKIIPLTRTIGMMIYGDLSFMGVPMPTVVARFRSIERTYATVEEAGETFSKFLETFPFDTEERFPNFQRALSTSLSAFCEKMENRIRNLGLNKALTFRRTFDEAVDAEIQRLSERPHFDAATIDSIAQYYPTFIEDETEKARERVSHGAGKDLRRLALAMLASKETSPSSTGYVIAGFGADESLPRLYSYETDGWFASHLKTVREEENVVIEYGAEQGGVAPFAQTAMIRRYMTGIDPDLYEFIRDKTRIALISAVDKLCRRLKASPVEALPARDRTFVKDLINAFCQDHDADIKEHRYETIVDPIDKMVACLTNNDMARFAVGLVATTALSQRYADIEQSVGGPVIVAQITPQDGFEFLDLNDLGKKSPGDEFRALVSAMRR